MAKAYVNTPTNHQKESLTNVKCGFKECTQVRLIASETQTWHHDRIIRAGLGAGLIPLFWISNDDTLRVLKSCYISGCRHYCQLHDYAPYRICGKLMIFFRLLKNTLVTDRRHARAFTVHL